MQKNHTHFIIVNVRCLLRGSYKGLMDVLTEFTRAAGAAQRVISLMDALPDIQPNSGRKLDQVSLTG